MLEVFVEGTELQNTCLRWFSWSYIWGQINWDNISGESAEGAKNVAFGQSRESLLKDDAESGQGPLQLSERSKIIFIKVNTI